MRISFFFFIFHVCQQINFNYSWTFTNSLLQLCLARTVRTRVCAVTVIFHIIILSCSLLGILTSLCLIVGLLTKCKELLLPWILTMIADFSAEISHFIYVVFFVEVNFWQDYGLSKLPDSTGIFSFPVHTQNAVIFTLVFHHSHHNLDGI